MITAIQFILVLLINSVILYIITDKLLVLDDSRFIKALIVTAIGSILCLVIRSVLGNPVEFHRSMYANITKYIFSFLPMFIIVKLAYRMSWKYFGYYFLVQLFFGGAIRFILISNVTILLNNLFS